MVVDELIEFPATEPVPSLPPRGAKSDEDIAPPLPPPCSPEDILNLPPSQPPSKPPRSRKPLPPSAQYLPQTLLIDE